MDDRRFDALIRAFGQGGSRRALLKGLLGLGGVTAAGAVLHDTEAARRGYSGPSTSTPGPQPTLPPQPTEPPPAPTGTTVPSCPGNQMPCGADCCCPAGHTKCGPDCCPDGQATCCDNACCSGTCFGEELCCPSPREFCAVSGQCCGPAETCGAEGCASGTCGGIGAACSTGRRLLRPECMRRRCLRCRLPSGLPGMRRGLLSRRVLHRGRLWSHL